MSTGSVINSTSRFSHRVRTILVALGAVAVFTFVVLGYVERDVLRVRGLVLALILIGVALVIRSERHVYVPISRRISR